MSELRDPLDRVSNSLRRAVSINKCQETDLRSTMNTIQRERRRSVNSWSLKQEKFLRAKQKLVPALKLEQSSRRPSQAQSMENSARCLTLAREVSPVSMSGVKYGTKMPSNSPYSQTTFDRPNASGNSLPPLKIPGRKAKQFRPVGLAAPIAAICNQLFQEPLAPTESQLRRARRVSEYKAAMSTDRWNETLQRRVRRFTEHRGSQKGNQGSISERNRKKNTERSGEKNVPSSSNTNLLSPFENISRTEGRHNKSMLDLLENLDKKENNFDPSNRHRTLGERDNSNVAELLPPLTGSRFPEGGDSKAKGKWTKVRQSLKTLTCQSQQKDISKMSLAEMTRLFEEIRECRYLRVGHHTSFRADNAMGAGCKCLACTVKDKTKLKNNLSAPD